MISLEIFKLSELQPKSACMVKAYSNNLNS